MSINTLFDGIIPDIVAGVVIYTAGFLSSKLWRRINAKRSEKKLKRDVRLAIKAIYESEDKYMGKKGKSAEKLEYATRRYMKYTGEKDYEDAQSQVLNIFNLTKLSK